jgi:hypothetical protein
MISYAYCIVIRPVRRYESNPRGTIYHRYATLEQAKQDAKELSANDRLNDYWAMSVSEF